MPPGVSGLACSVTSRPPRRSRPSVGDLSTATNADADEGEGDEAEDQEVLGLLRHVWRALLRGRASPHSARAGRLLSLVRQRPGDSSAFGAASMTGIFAPTRSVRLEIVRRARRRSPSSPSSSRSSSSYVLDRRPRGRPRRSSSRGRLAGDRAPREAHVTPSATSSSTSRSSIETIVPYRPPIVTTSSPTSSELASSLARRARLAARAQDHEPEHTQRAAQSRRG